MVSFYLIFGVFSSVNDDNELFHDAFQEFRLRTNRLLDSLIEW